MKNLLEYILIHLADYPEDIQITEDDQGGYVVFNVKANPADYGRIIGKSGSMIQSIRNIMMVRAIKEQKRVTVIVDSEENQSAPATQNAEVPAENHAETTNEEFASDSEI
ncbi:MAG: KH domain-containing protein [Pseudomonadales bacterium]|jgi:predicted RNA-binding protein YlqC (UPF0109 family)|nr:KH domain-containing protein [Pseudomonadales bacterium]